MLCEEGETATNVCAENMSGAFFNSQILWAKQYLLQIMRQRNHEIEKVVAGVVGIIKQITTIVFVLKIHYMSTTSLLYVVEYLGGNNPTFSRDFTKDLYQVQ